MLGTPKALEQGNEGKAVSRWKSCGPGEPEREKDVGGKGKGNYGRLARSNEHSPGVAISGSESRHALQVRWRAEDSRVQAGQPLALQEIAAGSVDGREVE